MTTNGKTVNWERVPENGAKPEDPLWFLTNPDEADYQAAIDLALEKGSLLRDAEASFGNGKIKQRHEGWLHRENADDRQRIDALKANHDRKVLSGDHLKELGELAAAGLEFVMDVGEYLEKRNAVRPASIKLNAETGNQEIVLATKPGHRQK
jgi:hypothetical protein